jgi:hypothetical protein
MDSPAREEEMEEGSLRSAKNSTKFEEDRITYSETMSTSPSC